MEEEEAAAAFSLPFSDPLPFALALISFIWPAHTSQLSILFGAGTSCLSDAIKGLFVPSYY